VKIAAMTKELSFCIWTKTYSNHALSYACPRLHIVHKVTKNHFGRMWQLQYDAMMKVHCVQCVASTWVNTAMH